MDRDRIQAFPSRLHLFSVEFWLLAKGACEVIIGPSGLNGATAKLESYAFPRGGAADFAHVNHLTVFTPMRFRVLDFSATRRLTLLFHVVEVKTDLLVLFYRLQTIPQLSHQYRCLRA